MLNEKKSKNRDSVEKKGRKKEDGKGKMESFLSIWATLNYMNVYMAAEPCRINNQI